MIVHKRKQIKGEIWTICGYSPGNIRRMFSVPISARWMNVTCPECLKQKPSNADPGTYSFVKRG